MTSHVFDAIFQSSVSSIVKNNLENSLTVKALQYLHSLFGFLRGDMDIYSLPQYISPLPNGSGEPNSQARSKDLRRLFDDNSGKNFSSSPCTHML